jgi:DNA-binding NarL/FixJ family response regulator
MAAATPQVALFSEHLLLGEALRSLLEAVGGFRVGSAESSPGEMLDSMRGADHDLAIVHLHNGLRPDLLALVEHLDGTPTAVLLDAVDHDAAERCLVAGARAVLETTTDPVTILAALRQVLSGHAVVPASTRAPLGNMKSRSPLGALSRRQLEVLRLLVAGRSNGEIAAALFISVNTVKFHTRSIFRELGIHSRVDAARRYPLLDSEPA